MEIKYISFSNIRALPSYKISPSYSETLPYSHLGNTVTWLLRPLFLKKKKKEKKLSLTRSNFFWPIDDRIDGIPLYLPTCHPFHFMGLFPDPREVLRYKHFLYDWMISK